MRITAVEKEDIINIIEDNYLTDIESSTFYITGINGILGGYFFKTIYGLNKYYNKKHKIIGLVRNIKKIDPTLLEEDFVQIINQDVTVPVEIEGNVDYVIHTAGPASPKLMKLDPVGVNLANTLGTINTLNIAKEKNSKGYLYISSREIYGEAEKDQKYFTEDGKLGYLDHTNVRNCYAESKKNAENLIVLYQHQYGMNVKSIRLAHTYGPGIDIQDGRVQSDFLNNYIHNEDIVLKSEGNAVRTYTYVSDAITAMFKILLESPKSEIIYNVSDEDNEISIRELAETIVDIGEKHGKAISLQFDIKHDANVSFAPFSLGLLSSAKLKRLGYKKRFNVQQGFERTIRHIEETLN